MKKYILRDRSVKASAIDFISRLPVEPVYEVTIKEHKKNRSNDQNALMWVRLSDIAKQVDWYGQKMLPADWKCVFTAALKQTKVVPNLDSTGFVTIGLYSSKLSVKEMNDLITLIEAFGAEHQVKWTAPESDLPGWLK